GSQHADGMFGHLGICNEPFVLANPAHQVSTVIPELPPTIDKTFVAFQGFWRPGRLHDLSNELISLRPIALDVVEFTIGNIKRPPRYVIQGRTGDVIAG